MDGGSGGETRNFLLRGPRVWVFLPGLDGTGTLLEPVLQYIPDGVRAIIVRYPTSTPSDASELLEIIEAAIPANEEFALIAESFTGPLALKIAGSNLPGLRALVLCASFARAPVALTFPAIACSLFSMMAMALRHFKIPVWLIRWFLLGNEHAELAPKVRQALGSVSPGAFASRFKVLLEFNDEFAPATVEAPILYIRPTQDRILRGKDLAVVSQRYPRVQVHEVESPHLVLQCKAKASVALIADFAQRSSNK